MNNLVLRAACFAQSFAAVTKDRRGVTAIEYGMIAALIAVVIIVTIKAIGVKLGAAFTAIDNGL
jgi:pilus assembly protein Flp/PilA